MCALHSNDYLVIESASFNCSNKVLLRNVSFNLKAGQICAVIGPSGAGKSTLLDVIGGRKLTGAWSGNVYINGEMKEAPRNSVRCAYVLQSDMHIPVLTVEETVRYAVQLRVGAEVSTTEKSLRVDHLLDALSLKGVKNCRIGNFQERGISGGQLKRVSIAVEMVADHRLLLLDEPTSGLDSLLSMEVISAVRKLVSEGRTAVATIHQPSKALFEMFDVALVLVRGRVFYFGPVSEVTEYFRSSPLDYPLSSGTSEDSSSINPAEYVLDVCCGKILSAGSLVRRTSAELEVLYRASKHHEAVQKAIAAVKSSSKSLSAVTSFPHASSGGLHSLWPYPASPGSQLLVLMERSWVTRVREVGDLRAQLFKHFALGIILGLIYFKKGDVGTPLYVDGYVQAQVQSLTSILFQITLVSQYANISAIALISSTIHHYRREQASGVCSPFLFTLTRYLAAIPAVLVNQFVLVMLIYLLSDLPTGAEYFFYFLLMSFTGAVTSFAMVMALTANSGSIANAFLIYPAQAEFFCTFAGYSIQISNIPVYWRWATYISNPRWMFEGFMINHWNRYDTDDYTGDAEDGNGDVLDLYSFSNFSKFDCVPIVLTFLVISLVAVCYGLGAPTNSLVKAADGAKVSITSGGGSTSTSANSRAATGLKEGLLLPEERLAASESDSGGHDDSKDTALPPPKPKLTVESFSASTGVVQAAQGCVLSFKDVYCEVEANTNLLANKSTKVLLKSVDGLVLPGQMCALMGSSGAGKSTLLDVLAQRKTTGSITGTITYNGSSKLTSFAYVMQDDVHIGALTVAETISFAAELRLPQHQAAEVKQKRVKHILNMLMLDSVGDSIIGSEYARNISGGELKRLSIGVEIVHLPDLMYLDEPTTGLDSSTSLEIVSALRNIANQHRTIICTIHQPSQDIFKLFDTAMVMADARVVYFGPTSAAVQHFTDSPFRFQVANGVDPADFIIAVASSALAAQDGRQVTAGELAVFFSTTELCMQTSKNIATVQQGLDDLSSVTTSTKGEPSQASSCSPEKSNRLTVPYQLQLLLGRKFLVIKRQWRHYVWASARDAVMSLFYASVWYQMDTGEASHVYTDRLGLLNRSNVYMILKHQDPSYIMDDRRTHYRERSTGAYGHFAYWVAVWLPRLPLELLNALLFTMFIYPVSGLRVGFVHYLAYLYFNIATNLCSFCLLSTAAALSPSMPVALSVINLLQVITLSLSGFSIYLPDMKDWVRWASLLDFARYGMQGMVVNELRDNSELPEGQMYIHMLGYQHIYVGDCVVIMLFYIALGGFCLFVALKYLHFEVR